MALGAQRSHPWVTYVRGHAATRLRVFCFPNAGSGVNNLRPWAGALPGDVALGLVHLPGREIRFHEAPFARLEPLVTVLASELRAELTGSFAFFGHSMGAIIAYELTRALAAQGRPLPKALLVSGRRAPQCPSRFQDIHPLPDAEFIGRMRELGGTPEEVLGSPELLEILLPVMRADVELAETYRPRDALPLACPIRAYGGRHDPFVSDEELEAWSERTTSTFAARRFDGGHFFIHDSREAFLRALAEDLDAIGRDVAGR